MIALTQGTLERPEGTQLQFIPILRRAVAALTLATGLAPGHDACAQGTAVLSKADQARIEREADRLVRAGEDYAFFIVEDKASGKFVQFASDDGGVAFDFPVIYAKTTSKEPVRDADCGTTPVVARAGEAVERLRPIEEEQRVKAVLTASRLRWLDLYCLHRTRAGKRAGYGMSITGRVAGPAAAAALVERMFVEAYGITSLAGLNFITDQDH